MVPGVLLAGRLSGWSDRLGDCGSQQSGGFFEIPSLAAVEQIKRNDATLKIPMRQGTGLCGIVFPCDKYASLAGNRPF